MTTLIKTFRRYEVPLSALKTYMNLPAGEDIASAVADGVNLIIKTKEDN
jgi:hypothetical protein